MNILPPIIDLRTRQPMEDQTKSNRGGHQEPLATFSIFFPTWTSYQKGDASRYLRIERGARHNRQLAAMQPQQRWVWVALFLVAKEGWVRDITVEHVAFESHCPDYKMVRRALDAMKREKLITADGDWNIESENSPKPERSQTKAEAKPNQSQSEANPKKSPSTFLGMMRDTAIQNRSE